MPPARLHDRLGILMGQGITGNSPKLPVSCLSVIVDA